MADLSVAQYYSILGNMDMASNFAKRAKNGLTPHSPEWLLADDIQNIN
jgi:predicted Zn-dependent protease